MKSRLSVGCMTVMEVVEGRLWSRIKHSPRRRIMLVAHCGAGGMILLMVMSLLAMVLLVLLLLIFVA